MVELADKLKKHTKEKLISIIKSYDNNYMLQESVKFMSSRLLELSKQQLKEG